MKHVIEFALFPNSFSYGVFANIGSGAVPGRRSGKVPGQVPNDSGKVPGQFFEPRSEPRTTGSRKVPGQVPIHEFREEYGLCLNIQHI